MFPKHKVSRIAWFGLVSPLPACFLLSPNPDGSKHEYCLRPKVSKICEYMQHIDFDHMFEKGTQHSHQNNHQSSCLGQPDRDHKIAPGTSVDLHVSRLYACKQPESMISMLQWIWFKEMVSGTEKIMAHGLNIS